MLQLIFIFMCMSLVKEKLAVLCLSAVCLKNLSVFGYLVSSEDGRSFLPKSDTKGQGFIFNTAC